eukprot:GHVN01099580.1.p1 GENE.GHVN01099580.1~~GHVN01099580.1.p1  ORF type:complete len:339 (+),score=21.89 GHVN01099580.1:101-1117(+)
MFAEAYAWVFPLVGALMSLAAILLCQVIAILKGHLTVEYQNNHYTLPNAPISLTANHSPEWFVYPIGMVITATMFCLTVPHLNLVLKKLIYPPPSEEEPGGITYVEGGAGDASTLRQRSQSGHLNGERQNTRVAVTTSQPNCCSSCLSCLARTALVFLALSCVALGIQSVVPLQADLLQESVSGKNMKGDVYSKESFLKPQSYIHLTSAALFFFTSYIHGMSIVTIVGVTYFKAWQSVSGRIVPWYKGLPVPLGSGIAKFCIMGAFPFHRLFAYLMQMLLQDPNVPLFMAAINEQGLEQRWCVLCIICMVCTYAIDLKGEDNQTLDQTSELVKHGYCD